MKLSGLIMETSTVHSTKSARPLSIVKFVFLCDNGNNGPAILLIELALLCNYVNVKPISEESRGSCVISIL